MSQTSSRLSAGMWTAPAPLTMIVIVSMLLMGTPGANKTGAPPASPPASEPEAKTEEKLPPLPVSAALQVLSDYQLHTSKVLSLPNTSGTLPKSTVTGKAIVSDFRDYVQALKDLKENPRQASTVSMPELKCVIALVPDPIDSHFPLTFDNAISSIVQAFGDHGYVRDRQLLLWQYGSKKDKDGKASERATPWRDQPGAILFRKTSVAHKPGTQSINSELVLVLLVGETPTAGVQRSAFVNALEIVVANELCSNVDFEKLTVPVIGPTFSGTSASLQSTLSLWWSEFQSQWQSWAVIPPRGRHLKINFVSGSATSASNQEILSFQQVGQNDHRLESTFHATVLPDTATHELLIKYLVGQNNIKAERIALLTEDTAYGQNNEPAIEAKATEFERHAKSAGQVDKPSTELEKVRRIPFPLSLSRMRSEYQKNEKAANSNNDSVAAKINVQRRNVTMDTESAQQAIDAIPTFSSVTPATADLALARILETIKQDEIQAVGIVATDVQDVLFLARQVRMYSPDVLLFTTENEVLYTHSDLTGALRGMLVASTYPLSTRVKRWFLTGAESHLSDLAFPSSSAQGIFNATVAQLNELNPEKQKPFRGYQLPLDTHGSEIPPLWLSVITESGIWPVEIRSIENELHAQSNKSNKSGKPINGSGERFAKVRAYVLPTLAELDSNASFSLVSVSRFPSLCFAVIGAFVIGLVLMCEGIRPRQRRLNLWLARNFLFCAELRQSRLTTEKFRRDCVIALTMMGVTLIECMLIVPLLMYWTSWAWLSGSRPFGLEDYISPSLGRVDALIIFFCLSALVTSISVAVLLAIKVGIHLVNSSNGIAKELIGALLLALTLAIPCSVILNMKAFLANQRQLVLFVDRAGELASGVSPVMPAVAITIAILLWAVAYWFRSCFIEQCRLESPMPCSVTPSGIEAKDVLSNATADVGRKLQKLKLSAQFVHRTKISKQDVLFCFMVLLNFLYVISHWVTTFEGWQFDWALTLLTSVALAMFLVLYLHAKTVCHRLLDLLRALAQHPILPAFQRTPQRIRDKVSEQLLCTLPDSTDLNQMLRQFFRASTKSPDCKDEVLFQQAGSQVYAKKLHEAYQAEVAETADVGLDLRRLSTTEEPMTALKKHSRMQWKLNIKLARFSREFIVPALTDYWLNQDGMALSKTEQSSESKEEQKDKTVVLDKARAHAEGELFLAFELLGIIRCAFVFIRNALMALLGMLLCFMVALQSYPFVLRNTIQSSLTWITCWVAASLVILMVQFNRNEVLSRIANSTPNRFELDSSFLRPMLMYVAVPLIGILTIQFPGLSRFLFGWLSGLSQLIPL